MDLKEKKEKNEIGIKFPEKRKFVTTTFRLSQEAHDAIREIARLYGVKNSEVFNMLLSFYWLKKKDGLEPSFFSDKKGERRIRKSYVVEKFILSSIKSISLDMERTTRDQFIDKLAIEYKKSLDQILYKKREKYRYILETTITPFLKKAEEIEKKLISELSEDDPITNRFRFIILFINNLYGAIKANIEKGIVIDPDDIFQEG